MASNRIKGITVEIGGDVTKLDKALNGVNKNISETQNKLRDVDKLLKLDPTNIELLDQKQRLLAQSAEQTADKYKALKQVIDTSTASNVKYDQWQQALSSLQGEITKTENALSALEKEQKKLQDLNFAPDSEAMVEVQQKIDATKEKLAGLEQKVVDTYEELGRPISVDQYDALQRELVEAEQAAKNADKAFREFHPTLEQVSAAASEFANKADGIYQATKGISAGAAVAAAGLIGMAVKAGQTADELNTLAKQSGFSTQTLQQWQYASDLVDVSVDSIISAAQKMKKNMDSTSADVQAAWERLGVPVRNATGQFNDAEKVFYAVLQQLSKIPNETERDLLAMTLFGKKADELAGIIDDGGAALQQLGQQAMEAGLILSQDALDGANAFNDGIDTLKAKATAAFFEAGASLAENLLPVLSDLVDIMSRVLNFIGNLDGRVLKFILTIAMVVATIAPIAKAVSGIANAVSGVTKVANLFSATAGNSVYLTFVKWAAIIIAVVAAVTALIALIAILTGKGNEVNQTLGNLSQAGAGQAGNIRPYSAPLNMDAVAEGLPGFASGGVFMPNHPIVGVMGDNRTEPEIAAPESTLKDTFAEVLDSRTSATKINITFSGSLAQLGRVLQPVITSETTRLGPSLT